MFLKMTRKSLKCPECTFETFMRIRRKWWMRLLPTSKLYCCEHCSKNIFVLLDRPHKGDASYQS